MPTIEDCIVLHGSELKPHFCSRFVWENSKIQEIKLEDPVIQIDEGAVVVMPSMCNSHTHMGDSCLPDGATGMTLEEGFFRPNGYKYRELSKRGESILPHVKAHLDYMAQSGTSAHIDFREMGVIGSQILREASRQSGVDSVILGQLKDPPFTNEELRANVKSLPENAVAELQEMLAVADGFSESTMNDLTDASWLKIKKVTREMGKMRAIHCLENDGYRDVSLEITGRGDLERAIDLLDPHIIIHLTVANDEEIQMLVDHEVTAVLNPRANANLGLPIPPIAKLIDAGVNLLLGTDNGMLNSPNMFAELDYTYKITESQYGNAVDPEPEVILKMATSNVGKVLGDRFPGYLEEGLPANFTLLDFTVPHLRATRHLLASICTRVTPCEVLATYREGKPIFINDRFKI